MHRYQQIFLPWQWSEVYSLTGKWSFHLKSHQAWVGIHSTSGLGLVQFLSCSSCSRVTKEWSPAVSWHKEASRSACLRDDTTSHISRPIIYWKSDGSQSVYQDNRLHWQPQDRELENKTGRDKWMGGQTDRSTVNGKPNTPWVMNASRSPAIQALPPPIASTGLCRTGRACVLTTPLSVHITEANAQNRWTLKLSPQIACIPLHLVWSSVASTDLKQQANLYSQPHVTSPTSDPLKTSHLLSFHCDRRVCMSWTQRGSDSGRDMSGVGWNVAWKLYTHFIQEWRKTRQISYHILLLCKLLQSRQRYNHHLPPQWSIWCISFAQSIPHYQRAHTWRWWRWGFTLSHNCWRVPSCFLWFKSKLKNVKWYLHLLNQTNHESARTLLELQVYELHLVLCSTTPTLELISVVLCPVSDKNSGTVHMPKSTHSQQHTAHLRKQTGREKRILLEGRQRECYMEYKHGHRPRQTD